MRYLTPREKRRRRIQRVRLGVVLVASFLIFTLLDYPLMRLFYYESIQHVELHDWYRLLRIIGYLGTWLMVCIIYIAHDRNQHRGLAVLFSAGAAGIISELLKLTIARERPVQDGIIQPGLYHFRGMFSGFEGGSNLAFPSSHAAVAFGGCLMMAYFMPRARGVLIILAIGCGMTRLLTGAHFASDVFVAALIGWWASKMICACASPHVPGLAPRYRLPI